MWIAAITGFCFGIAFAGVAYRLRMWYTIYNGDFQRKYYLCI